LGAILLLNAWLEPMKMAGAVGFDNLETGLIADPLWQYKIHY